MVVLSWFGYSQPWLISGYHDRGVALALAVGIAWLSYRFVETRFRHRRSPAPEGRSGRLALSGGAATAAIPREG
jgi:peptidoglycan/LPS O-acetylase OafA/YrhL